MGLRIGEYVVEESMLGLGPNFETVYRVIAITPMTIELEKIVKVIAWNDSSYKYPRIAAERCILEGLAIRFYVNGNSGVVSRNWFVLETNEITVGAYVARRVAHYMVPEARPDDILGQTKDIVIADPEIKLRCLQILTEEREREAVAEWEKLLGDKDVVECKEFNKTLAYSYINEPPDGFAVAAERSTSCGNTTVILIRLKGKIHCPDDLKGALIGRGGQNIKRLSAQYGRRIELV